MTRRSYYADVWNLLLSFEFNTENNEQDKDVWNGAARADPGAFLHDGTVPQVPEGDRGGNRQNDD